MKVTRKSLHRSKNGKLWKKRAHQRAAKERKRIALANAEPTMPDVSHVVACTAKPSGFRVIIICHDDGERVQFDSMNGPHGLTISPTIAGRKVACVFANYRPANQHENHE